MLKRKIDLELPLFLLWPFGSFLLALRSIPSRKSGFIYVLFTTLFGYAFSFTTESADSYRVARQFSRSNHDIATTFENYKRGAITDIYKDIMYGITELFSNNPKLLFALFGFIFGFFSYLSLKLLLSIKREDRSIYVAIISLVFFASNAFININGARFYTAAIIALCAIINLMYYGRKLWLLPLFATVFIHFSYLFIIPVIFGIFLFKSVLFNKAHTPKWIFILFIISFFVSFLSDTNLFKLNFLSEILSPSVSNKVELYNSSEISDEYAARGETLFHTVSRTFVTIVKFYFLFIIISVRKTLKNSIVKDEKLQLFFSFVLLFYSLTFLFSIVPSGGRFITISQQLFLFFLVRFFIIERSKLYERYIVGLLPAFSFLILFQIGYLGYVFTSSTLWYGNLFWLIYEGLDYQYIYN